VEAVRALGPAAAWPAGLGEPTLGLVVRALGLAAAWPAGRPAELVETTLGALPALEVEVAVVTRRSAPVEPWAAVAVAPARPGAREGMAADRTHRAALASSEEPAANRRRSSDWFSAWASCLGIAEGIRSVEPAREGQLRALVVERRATRGRITGPEIPDRGPISPRDP
jgi:hypothetical protein